MVYKVIGLMSGSSLDGLDIAYVHLQERTGSSQQTPRTWEFQFVHTACYPYPELWRQRLASAPQLSALDYQLLHTDYGHYLAQEVLRFIEANGLDYQVQLIVSHGHTVFHWPERKMTAQLGDGAALAGDTRINVVSDLRAMDLALGGQGAPIVPIGEQLLLPGYEFFLNLGGIANISAHRGAGAGFAAFDVCPANRVLNELAADKGLPFDDNGAMAASGQTNVELLQRLNALPYYNLNYPKSLANTFGTETLLPLIRATMPRSGAGKEGLSTADALRTYTEHIVGQVCIAVSRLIPGGAAADETRIHGTEVTPGGGAMPGAAITTGGGATPRAAANVGAAETVDADTPIRPTRMLVTGGGAHNGFLASRLRDRLGELGVQLVVPDKELVDYKEALIMALIGVLRWREENNVLASVTGASRDSIGGAVWIGQEA